MTKIVFWNIMNINHENMKKGFLDESTKTIVKHRVQENILYNVTKTDPDIFSVMEFNRGTNTTEVGDFIQGNPATTAIYLLTQLNATQPKTKPWKLIPPIITGTEGRREGVGVYYRSDKLTFTGPWYCNYAPPSITPAKKSKTVTTKYANTTSATTPSTPMQYPDIWSDGTFTKTEIKGGRWKFNQTDLTTKKSLAKIQNYPDVSERRPWMTTFTELSGTKRDIEVFSFHAAYAREANTKKGIKGDSTLPRRSLQALADTFEISYEALPNPNTVRIVGGDFNVDANKKGTSEAYPYVSLAANFGAGSGAFWDEQPTITTPNEYFKTSLSTYSNSPKASGAASVSGTHPNYSFTVSAYDHAFVKDSSSVNPLKNQMILNMIIGISSDYAGPPSKATGGCYGLPNTLPAGKSLGTNTVLESKMANSLHDIINNPLPPGVVSRDVWFRQFNNFGNIRRTSDHMGIVIEF